MRESENKIIDKIEKLLKLSSSSNENEARSAMMKAQELMAKYEIKREQLRDGEQEERNTAGVENKPVYHPEVKHEECTDHAACCR